MKVVIWHSYNTNLPRVTLSTVSALLLGVTETFSLSCGWKKSLSLFLFIEMLTGFSDDLGRRGVEAMTGVGGVIESSLLGVVSVTLVRLSGVVAPPGEVGDIVIPDSLLLVLSLFLFLFRFFDVAD